MHEITIANSVPPEYQGMSRVEVARAIIAKHGRVSPNAVREFRSLVLAPICDCKDFLDEECASMHVEQLEAENAKLRELVAELWALADGYTPDDSELDTARDIMRELGIEVED